MRQCRNGGNTALILFGDFAVDPDRALLLRSGEPLRLRVKTWRLLVYLLGRPGAVVTLDELYPVLWPATAVEPQALAHLVWELRRALGDNRSPPRYIETVTKRGYRFIGFEAPQPELVSEIALPADPAAAAAEAKVSAGFIGRRDHIHTLDRLWQGATAGQRQLVLIAGEPGIGKTSLLEQWQRLSGLGRGATTANFVLRGQGVLQHGAGEPYMPILAALGQLPASTAITEALRREAPAWLAQLPWLIEPDQMQAVRAALAGSGPSRMLRESMRLLNALAAISPLLLIIEDAHWADPATIDLLRLCVEAHEPARLLFIVTYRPIDIALGNHPLRAAIAHVAQRTAGVTRIDLGPLSSAHVDEYLQTRLPGIGWGRGAFESMERISGGNPLFLRTLADDFIERGLVRRSGERWELVEQRLGGIELPHGLRNMVGELTSHLSQAERELLQAAAVVGDELNARDVAAALQQDEGAVEMALSDIADGGRLLQARSEVVWPDGSASSTFAFAHALYRDALYDGIPARRRQQWHLRIGDRLTSGGADDTRMEIAALAASHYGAAAEWEKEAGQLELAAFNALRRYAFRESRDYLLRVIAALQRLPDSAQRDCREVERQLDLWNLSALLNGFTDESLDAAQARALQLARRQQAWQLELRALLAACLSAIMRADVPAAGRDAEQLLAIAAQHPEAAASAHLYSATVSAYLGEVREALVHTERAYAHLDVALPNVPRGQPLRRSLAVMQAMLFACLGELTQARKIADSLIEETRRDAGPDAAAWIFGPLSRTYLFMGDYDRATATADMAIAAAEAYGMEIHTGVAQAVRAAARCVEDPNHLGELNAALAICRQRGELSSINYFRNELAAAHWRRGEIETALVLLDANLQEENRGTDALGWCLRGEIVGGAEGEACFDRAIATARRQELKLVELHILTTRYRRLAAVGPAAEARQALVEVYEPLRVHTTSIYVRRAGELLADGEVRTAR